MYFSSLQELIENLTTVDYQKHVSGLVSARLTKPKKLRARHGRYWSEIATENYHFNRDEVETEHVKTISQAQLIDFFMVHGTL